MYTFKTEQILGVYRKAKSVLSPPGCNVLCLKIILASKRCQGPPLPLERPCSDLWLRPVCRERGFSLASGFTLERRITIALMHFLLLSSPCLQGRGLPRWPGYPIFVLGLLGLTFSLANTPGSVTRLPGLTLNCFPDLSGGAAH